MRLVSAGPLFFFARRAAGLAAGALICAACAATPVLRVHPQVRAIPSRHAVELDGRVACREGFLEQLVCLQGTRDHEALVTTSAPPSAVHAALLAAGLRCGAPGAWSVDASGALRLTPPSGDGVQVLVRWTDADGDHQSPLAAWALPVRPEAGASSNAFVFAGSRFRAMPDGSERYQADDTGSVVGLVTFGDEVVALGAVVPDKVDVAPAAWRARTSLMPPTGSAVTVILQSVQQP